jgi:hypothetical protein
MCERLRCRSMPTEFISWASIGPGFNSTRAYKLGHRIGSGAHPIHGIKRIRGSRHIIRHPDIPDAIPIPLHGNRTLKRGTLANILRAAGLTREELGRLL